MPALLVAGDLLDGGEGKGEVRVLAQSAARPNGGGDPADVKPLEEARAFSVVVQDRDATGRRA